MLDLADVPFLIGYALAIVAITSGVVYFVLRRVISNSIEDIMAELTDQSKSGGLAGKNPLIPLLGMLAERFGIPKEIVEGFLGVVLPYLQSLQKPQSQTPTTWS